MSPETRWWPSILARWHAARGWISYRFGLRTRAQRHYERVLHLCGSDFAAHVQLSRIAFARGDYAAWRRQLELARLADPARFAKLPGAPAGSTPRLAGTGYEFPVERTPGRAPRAGHATTTPHLGERLLVDPDTEAAARPSGGDAAGRSAHADDDDLAEDGTDDCRDESERRRLRRLGPIGPTELQACDLDELARRLGG
jgi:hypothetical protein